MNSLHQTRENLRLIDNALCELAEVYLWDDEYHNQFQRVFGQLSSLHNKIGIQLKELEEQCLENMKS